VEIYAKLEYFNPGGSVKDRPALQMILDAQESGRLTPGKTLIDATSGNTGVAYAWIGAALGIPVALVVPENVSLARKQVASAFGAQLIYSDPMEGSDGAIRHVSGSLSATRSGTSTPTSIQTSRIPAPTILGPAPKSGSRPRVG